MAGRPNRSRYVLAVLPTSVHRKRAGRARDLAWKHSSGQSSERVRGAGGIQCCQPVEECVAAAAHGPWADLAAYLGFAARERGPSEHPQARPLFGGSLATCGGG